MKRYHVTGVEQLGRRPIASEISQPASAFTLRIAGK